MTMSNPEQLPFEAPEVTTRLLAWYGREGRDLPWRQTRDPYRIWLSEIMLQQTTVAAVIPYYQRFLDAFPTVDVLAVASLDQVLELWAGLGYYSRARNLQQAAQVVTTQCGGDFPRTLEGLMALPGVGRSTAGAILSIAYDQPAPILDGNVRRVLVRLFALTGDPRSSQAERQLWEWAALLTSQERPHDYAQAIMDLGATVCIPRGPVCGTCPLRGLCQAYARGLTEELPVKRKQAKVPTRHQVALVVVSDQGLLVRQRPPKGLLGGMWEFPLVDLDETTEDPVLLVEQLSADLGECGPLSFVGTIRHAYSHFKLVLTVYSANRGTIELGCETSGCWRSSQQLKTLPLHGAHRKALELFLQKHQKAVPCG